MDDCGHSPQSSLWPCGKIFREPAHMDDQRAGRKLLFWRNVAADRNRRGDGYGDADRGATDYASLRRLHAAERQDPRTTQLVVNKYLYEVASSRPCSRGN